jgi:zinc/manganese transport system permease protein
MSDALHVMLWPMLACLLLPGLLVYMGLHVVRRGIIFVDLALAQVAALGICTALVTGHEPDEWQTTLFAGGFTLVGAALLTFTRSARRNVPQEALIGIVYVVAAAGGILLLSQSPHGDEELRRTLVGELLFVRPETLWRTCALFAAVGVVHTLARKPFLRLTMESHGGVVQKNDALWEFLFYALFGFAVTSFVRIGGVLLTFSYLIIPAVAASWMASSWRSQLLAGWSVATIAGMTGLFAAYRFDLPTGAAVVCALGLSLLVVGFGRRLAS